jgi:hypothetical protein
MDRLLNEYIPMILRCAINLLIRLIAMLTSRDSIENRPKEQTKKNPDFRQVAVHLAF